MRYVVGFMFSPDQRLVALIRKTKPKWQAGRLNGIGGKVEDGESPEDAMIREFREETGCNELEWRHRGTIGSAGSTSGRSNDKGEPWSMEVFSCFSDSIFTLETTTEEEVVTVNMSLLAERDDLLDNILWLSNLCLDQRPLKFNIQY